MPKLASLTACILAAATLPAQTAATASTTFSGSAMYYDQDRDRLVIALPSQAIWEWDGAHWARSSALAPTRMYTMTYDRVRHRAFSVASAHLYSFDGHAFTDHGPAPALTGMPLVVDTHRGRLIGLGNGNATFEWDGAQWLPGPSLPNGFVPLSIAFDEHLGATVVIGLSTSPVTFLTLHGDGIAWTVMNRSSLPHSSLAYDPVAQRVISTGGTTWSWDGANWTQLSTLHSGIVGAGSSDPIHGRLWVFNNSSAGQALVRSWDGSDWTAGVATPFPADGTTMTFDSARGRAVVFAGSGSLHEWDGAQWHDIVAANAPPYRTWHNEVFDAARGETIVFGGADVTGTALADTWGWNGTSWRLAATNGPSPRPQTALTFDSGRNRVVLVGGDPNNAATDHWEWDGSNWTQIAASIPMLNVAAVMGYDPVRARVVRVDEFGATYEYDGTAWTMAAVDGPQASSRVDRPRALTWNPNTQRLAGNLLDSTAQLRRHEWDGSNWTALFPSAGEPVFDTTRNTMLVFSKTSLITESTQLASATDYGTPCGGTSVTTSLTAFSLPRPGDAAFHLDLRAEATQRPALLGLGFGTANVPVGSGCSILLANSVASFLWFTDGNGCWHQPLTMPADLALRGVSFDAQAAVLDPNSPGGFALSQGLALVVGS